MTLTGTGLSEVVTVAFGATPAAFTVLSDTTVVATAPAGSGTVQVTVTSPGGTSNGLPYTYLSAPVVTTVAPNQGPTAGGTTVTVTGSGFTGATDVRFGSTPATTFTVVSGTQITAVAPPGGAGMVHLTVTTAGGTSSTFYYYLNAPVLTSVVPTQGPTSGGITLTLTGSGLSQASAVHFGAAAATSFTVVSDNQALATVPAGSGTVQVTVTSPG
ncbi:IPT/TIG domain-containing protein, partial [Kitasatospora nipponensis]|uniref:IPT/TIG domain-containing protein n=1 Tax=Kitasatospora nipponensis TaxID=258049 RepID=UPI0031D5C0A7